MIDLHLKEDSQMSGNEPESEDDFKPKYSLSHLTLLDCSTPELIEIASRAGYDSISPRLIPMGVEGEYPYSLIDKDMMRDTASAMKATGVSILDIELARITDHCVVKSYEPGIAAGAELGAENLIASAWTSGRMDFNYIADTYAEICDLAKPYGLRVILEFPSFSRLQDLQDAAAVVKAVDRENSGILIDTMYMHMSRINPEELEGMPSKWFQCMHICDVLSEIPNNLAGIRRIARSKRLFPGEGCINFQSILEKLPPVNYSLEIPNHKKLAKLGKEEYARQCLVAAKKTLEPIKSKRV